MQDLPWLRETEDLGAGSPEKSFNIVVELNAHRRLERNAFVTTLAKFTFLNNLGEMKTKNMEAIKTLLDVAVTEGNNLKSSWREVLTCVSQLEHMQLISSGVDVPDGKKGYV